ncbi:hypothetical protein RhiirB3_442235 [Rhizophagus irregularis]|nr:hypothetical protein RhiirB3_442235 [Rhizophagus irregularis]
MACSVAGVAAYYGSNMTNNVYAALRETHNTTASATIESLSREINISKEYVENIQLKYQFVKLTSLFLEITELLYADNDKSSYIYNEVYKIYEDIHSRIKSSTGISRKGKNVSWEKKVKHILKDENIFEENGLYRMNPIRMKCFVGKMLVEEYENYCYEADDNNVKNIAYVLITTIDSIMNDMDIDAISHQLKLY